MDYVAMQARLRPGKLALADLASGREWTYAELDRFVSCCASVLLARGTGGGDRVACLSKNCAEIVVLHHACARLGAIFVPLNWRLAKAELEFLLEDCHPSVLFGDARAQEMGFRHEAIADLSSACAAMEPHEAFQPDADLPSLILYTSGTTGRPKGALLSERNLTETAINLTLLASANTDSTFLVDAPMFHVIGLVANIRPALFNGGRILVSDAFDPDRTIERLMDTSLEITHYFCVPQMAHALRQTQAFDPSRLGHLTAIFTGGAPHPEAQIRQWLDDGIPIVDGFGMSETGTVFGMPIDPALITRKAGSVGIATPRVMARVVDEKGLETVDGEAGELQLRGENLFRGYWRREQEYAASMTEDGWFGTGDIATRDSDGFFRIVDRKKDMYISGGENVYPAEVEAVIAEMEAVSESAIVGVPDEQWGEVGRAYIIPVSGDMLSGEEVLEHCRMRLARFKVPKTVIITDTLPRTASGKLQKQVLQARAIEEIAEECFEDG